MGVNPAKEGGEVTFKVIVSVWLLIEVGMQFGHIDKPREPKTAVEAVSNVIGFAFIVTGLWLWV